MDQYKSKEIKGVSRTSTSAKTKFYNLAEISHSNTY